MTPFVTADWLADNPDHVLVDVRWYADGSPGRAEYEKAHLPGAVFVDLDTHLAAPPSPAEGRHPLPDPAVFAEGMELAGISDDTVVIAYDDDSGAVAARLVWLLRVTGHRAALLDGGIRAWRGRRETGPSPEVPRGSFAPRPWPAEALVGIDQVTSTVLLDGRPRERYRGEVEPLDARPGHVPGAVSVPARENVDERGLLLPVPELRRRLLDAGVGPDGWASSCGSGVVACHTLLLAEHLGLPQGRLYPGSWSQWSHTDRPAALGD